MLEILEYFQKGGIVMYPLLACSIVALGIFIERVLYYQKAEGSQQENAALYDHLQKGDKEALNTFVEQGEGDSCKLVQYFLTLDQERQAKLQTLETKVNIMMESYEDHLSILSVIITLSPLMGLLGTILGIIKSFSVFNVSSDQPFAITAGIGEALIATGFGIIVAIFALLLHGGLKLMIGKLNHRLELCALKLAEQKD